MNVRGLSKCQALLLGKLGDPYPVWGQLSFILDGQSAGIA